MARYIDADALIERLGINQDCTECPYCTRKCYCSWNPDPGEICIAIAEQPTVTIKDTAEENKVTNCNYNQFADVSKKVSSSCDHENDLIHREDALNCFHDWIDQRGDVHTADEMPEYQQIEQLPSAQPETNCSEFPNNSDTINRQDAIDAVEALAYHADKYVMDSDVHEVHGFRTGLAVAERQLSLVPSAEPEPCVDTVDALDESIKHFDDMAEECRRNASIERNDYMDMRDDAAEYRQLYLWLNELKWFRERFQSQPYTEAEIQRMQDLEQAEINKAFELGKEEGRKEAQPKTGKWIHCGWTIACSECNYDMPWAVRNYCPSCGARMKDEGRRING